MVAHPVPSEPDLAHWLCADRCERLHALFASSKALLAEAALLRPVLKAWLEHEMVVESGYEPDPTALEALHQKGQRWAAKQDLAQLGLDPNQLLPIQLRRPALQAWARHHWQHRLESLYLARQSELSMASCRILRVSNHALAQELYHRIVSDGDAFDALATTFGVPHQDGYLSLRSLASLPAGLPVILQRMEPGELSIPLRLGDGFALVQLEAWQPARFDPSTQDTLLQQELRSWCEAAVDRLIAELRSNQCS